MISKVQAVVIGALSVCVAVLVWTIVELRRGIEALENPPPVIRYHCDDDTDTTKGVAKGVLTNCKPVVIERRM